MAHRFGGGRADGARVGAGGDGGRGAADQIRRLRAQLHAVTGGQRVRVQAQVHPQANAQDLPLADLNLGAAADQDEVHLYVDPDQEVDDIQAAHRYAGQADLIQRALNFEGR